jgi:hypothetical protein
VDTSKKLKKLTYKLQYLRVELEEVEEAHSRAKWELNNAVFEIFARCGKKIQTQENGSVVDPPPPLQEDEIPIINLDADLKKIVRKIALKTHPDRTSSLTDDVKAYYESLYRDVMSAAKDADEGRIIEIALELDIDIELDEMRHTKPLEELTSRLERKIDQVKRTPEIIWLNHRDHDEIRCNMLVMAARNMGLDLSTQIALDIVNWVKAGCPNGTQYTKVTPARPDKIWEKRRPGIRPERISR